MCAIPVCDISLALALCIYMCVSSVCDVSLALALCIYICVGSVCDISLALALCVGSNVLLFSFLSAFKILIV
jgi:hypothetical protein